MSTRLPAIKPVPRSPGRPAEVQGGKTRRLYAGEDDWQWLCDLGDGEPSAGLRNARSALDPTSHGMSTTPSVEISHA